MKISVKLRLQCYRDVARIMHTGIDFSKDNEQVLGWGKKHEHYWSNNVGGQKLNHLISHLSNVETSMINMIIQNFYLGFCQTFQPNKFGDDDVHRN